MTALRILRLAPALLLALLLAAPAAAEPWPPADAAIATHEGTVQNVGLPGKLADHATRRSHRNASLEEFVSIDDDAEQDLTSPPVLRAPGALPASAVRAIVSFYAPAPRTHRACAPFQTGPPHA